MHDPMTVAFSGKYVTVWHIDPESDGSDDSCGWSRPRIGKERLAKLKSEAEFERQFFFGKKYATLNLNTASCYEVIYAIWAIIRWRFYRKQVTAAEIKEISDLASSPTDNLRHLVYEAKHDAEEFVRLWYCIYRAQARHHRKWYQHPKWHIRHWRIQIHIGRKVRFYLPFPRAA
jgi:hypothetical protein